MIKFLYNFCLHLYGLAMLPKMIFRKTFFSKLGVHFPTITIDKENLVWVHAVSFGETKAACHLIKKLKERVPHLKILLTTSTKTGYLEGKKSEAHWHAYLPFDLPYIIRPLIKKIKPHLIVLIETDLWLNFLDAAKRHGSKVVIANAKLSEKSFLRYKRFSWFSNKLFGLVDLFLLQGVVYKERFQKLAIEESKLHVTGNIKLDSRKSSQTPAKDLILTLGSTHWPEEKIWILALPLLWKKFPKLKVIIAPRHPERFEKVAKLLVKHGLSFTRYSEKGLHLNDSILLMDAMGMLQQCYAISTLAFVGGSLTPKVGGHNITEPLFFGKPVLYGPFLHKQPDFKELIQAWNAGLEVNERTLVKITERLLESRELQKILGDRGLQLLAASQGSLSNTLNQLLKMMDFC